MSMQSVCLPSLRTYFVHFCWSFYERGEKGPRGSLSIDFCHQLQIPPAEREHNIMPRPKVRPEDRQRSSRACLACKASKIRCDSQLPCASCIRRDQANSCVYSGTDRRRRHHGIAHQRAGPPGDPSHGIVPANGQTSPMSVPLAGPVTPDQSNDGNPSTPLPEDRLLTDSSSEKGDWVP